MSSKCVNSMRTVYHRWHLVATEGQQGLSQRVKGSQAQCVGVQAPARPDMGERGTGLWVVRVCGRLLSLNCAANEAAMRSGSGENGYARTAKRGKRASQASRVPKKGWKWKPAAGGNAPLRKMAERGILERSKPSTLPGSRRLADEADQGALVGHKVTLQDGHIARGQPMHGHPLEP